MAFCGKCGNQLIDGAKFCPKCGNPVNNGLNPKIEPNNGNLYIRWDGAWTMFDVTVSVIVNGKYVGDYSFNEGFEATVPIESEIVRVRIKCSVREYTQVLILSPNSNYSLNLSYNRISGGFGFLLCDNNGMEIYNDSLHWGMTILCFLIPIVGFIYALFNRKDKPAASKDALILSVIGFAVGLLLYYGRLLG